jgi:hypothetical protein
MILELKHNAENVNDIHTVACVYWKIPISTKKDPLNGTQRDVVASPAASTV